MSVEDKARLHENSMKPIQTASAKKVKLQTVPTKSGIEDAVNCIWNIGQLQRLLKITQCRLCGIGNLDLQECTEQRMGWCSYYGLKCSNYSCDNNENFEWIPTSNIHDSKADINVQGVLSFRLMGKSRNAAERFSSSMNLPEPLSWPSWTKVAARLEAISGEACEVQMQESGQKVHSIESKDKHGFANTGVTTDGSWQSRHCSRHGIVTVMSAKTGEILDAHYMANSCPQCKKFEGEDRESEKYQKFIITHYTKCHVNHNGSAMSMEQQGTVTIFGRSQEKHKLRYTNFIGDGDSKAFKKVQAARPYGDIQIQKEECIGHVQKRMGSRLRGILNKNKGK